MKRSLDQIHSESTILVLAQNEVGRDICAVLTRSGLQVNLSSSPIETAEINSAAVIVIDQGSTMDNLCSQPDNEGQLLPPIILISNAIAFEKLVQLMRCGVTDIVSTTLNGSELLEAVTRARAGGAKARLQLKQQSQKITELEQEIERHHRKLNSFVDTATNVLAFVDENDKVIVCNKAVTVYFGIKREELLGKPIQLLFDTARSTFESPAAFDSLIENLRKTPDGELDDSKGHEKFLARALKTRASRDQYISIFSMQIPGQGAFSGGRLWGMSDITEMKNAAEHLRTVVDATPIPLIVTRLSDGHIIYANKHLGEMMGRPPDKLIGEKAPDFYYDPNDRKLVLEDLHKSGKSHREIRLKSPERAVIWSIFSLVTTELDGEQVIIGGLYDITHRRRMEEELLSERNFISAVLRTAGALVIVLDTEGKIVQFNRACEQVSEYSAEEAIGRSVWDFLLPEDAIEPVKEVFRQIKTGSFTGTMENYWVTRSGEKRLIQWRNTELMREDDSRQYVIATGIDITEKRMAEDALRVSEVRFRNIVENASDIIFLLDREGSFSYVSPNWETQLGHSPNEVLGQSLLNFVHPGDLTDCRDCLREMLETLERQYGLEYRVRHNDGDWRWHTISISPMTEADGELMSYVCVSHDVTERKRTLDELAKAYKNLRETQGQLVQSEKMASLGMLVAGIAHEINTPTGAVVSMHGTLMRALGKLKNQLETYCLDPGQREQISTTMQLVDDANRVIVSGTDRVKSIVRRLRSFARLDEAESKTVDIHEGLEDTLALIHHEVKHDIEIVRDFGKLPPVTCYPGRLNQVFLNLLINAKQAIVGKGSIKIRTRSEGDMVVLEFSDSGVGIPSEYLNKIFDPGFTTKGVGVGTGLGLSICYQIIQDHQGTITVESNVGEGTTFTLKLPVSPSFDVVNSSTTDDGKKASR